LRRPAIQYATLNVGLSRIGSRAAQRGNGRIDAI